MVSLGWCGKFVFACLAEGTFVPIEKEFPIADNPNLPAALKAIGCMAFALVLVGCEPASMPTPSPPGYKLAVFANGNVQFDIPEKYELRYEQDESIMVRPSEHAGIILRFTLQNLPEPIAEDFLLTQAEKDGMEIKEMGKNLVISESGSRNENGQDFNMTFWQVGFEDALVVMSAEVNKTRKDEPAVLDCLALVPAMIESMHKF